MSSKPQSSQSAELMRYAGLATQLFVAIGLSVFAGYQADKWLHTSLPLLVWLLPLVVLSLLIYKLVKDTSKRKNTHAD
jgi:TctA family transporter